MTMSVAQFYFKNICFLRQHGIKCERVDNSLFCDVVYCGDTVTLEFELVPESVANQQVFPVDVHLPRVIEHLSLDHFPSLQTDWALHKKSYLLNIVGDVMRHYGNAHQTLVQQYAGSERFSFEVETFLKQKPGVLYHFVKSDENEVKIAVAIPLDIEMPKFYALYGNDPKFAFLIVNFHSNQSVHPNPLYISLPNRLHEQLLTPIPMPKWDKDTCLSSYVPTINNILVEFVHAVRLRRAVVAGLTNSLQNPLEIDHIHYLRARFLKQVTDVAPPVNVVLHVDFDHEFPTIPPRLGLSCLSWVDAASGKPFSRAIKGEWSAVRCGSVEAIISAIADILIANLPSFIQKATSGTRNTSYFLKR